MSPKRIIKQALSKKLDIVGICDHNSAENVAAAKNCGSKKSITVLPGIEITTAEEVHLLALFDEVDDTLSFQEMIYDCLCAGENRAEVFGEQLIVNESDEIVGRSKRLLMAATKLTLKECVTAISERNGLTVASHIDRESYSIIGQLGFIPNGLRLDALEISPATTPVDALRKFPEAKMFPLISSSDAHFLSDIGKRTTRFLLAEPTVREIKQALTNKNGRRIEIKH